MQPHSGGLASRQYETVVSGLPGMISDRAGKTFGRLFTRAPSGSSHGIKALSFIVQDFSQVNTRKVSAAGV